MDFLFKNSDAYRVAENYIKSDIKIERLTGGIRYFGIMPSGSISSIDADLYIKVIGQSNDLNVNVKLDKGDKWTVKKVDLK